MSQKQQSSSPDSPSEPKKPPTEEEYAKSIAALNGQPIPYEPREPNPWAILDLQAAISQPLVLADKRLIPIVCGAVIAHEFRSQPPVWMILVEPPSHAKTSILEGVLGLPNTYYLEELTPSALQSAWQPKKEGEEPPSLLKELDKKIAICPELGSLLEMRPDAQKKVFAKLRAAYDGRTRISSGSGVNEPWSGRFGFIAGATPAFDRSYIIRQQMGERFLIYRPVLPSADAMGEKILSTMRTKLHPEEQDTLIATAFSTWRERIGLVPDYSSIAWSPGTLESVIELAKIVAVGRTFVMKDRDSKEVIEDPDPEGPGRVIWQLASLAAGIAVACGKREVDDREIDMIRRVVQSNLPKLRCALLRYLAGREPKTYDAAAEAVGASRPHVMTLQKEFSSLKITERKRFALTNEWRHRLEMTKLFETPEAEVFSYALPEQAGSTATGSASAIRALAVVLDRKKGSRGGRS